MQFQQQQKNHFKLKVFIVWYHFLAKLGEKHKSSTGFPPLSLYTEASEASKSTYTLSASLTLKNNH